jgi:hypothetical protein
MLSIGGWLSWQAIRAFVPWASPALAYGLAALATVGLLLLYGYHLGADGEAAAVAERDLEWVTRYNEANDQLDVMRQAARRAAEAELPTSDDHARRLQQCRQSPTCRDR